MGYHIIFLENGTEPSRYYTDDIKELAYIDEITDQTLIYEGEESQYPRLLCKHEKFKKFAELRYRVGKKAEDLFKEQAKANKLIVTQIDQSLEDFEQYKNAVTKKIKRGDFLIRNANLEIEVKCKTVYLFNGDEYFYLNIYDVERHTNMMQITATPVVFAIYARDADEPNPDKLYMIEAKNIKENIDQVIVNKEYYMIPLTLFEEGFNLVERFRIKE